MYRFDDRGHLAVIQKVPESHTSIGTCHFSSDVDILFVYYCSIAAVISPCFEIEISVYGKDHHNANIRAYPLHLGSCGW